jgi:NADPH:quinone reductase-like Zn-dependent oxidoreductase
MKPIGLLSWKPIGFPSLSTLEYVMTALKGANVFVTGGSRGIGKALVEELYARGAGKVYATTRAA